MLWIIPGGVCLAYYIILKTVSQGQQLTAVWLCLAMVFFLIFLYKKFRARHPRKKELPLWWRTFCWTTLILLAVLLGVAGSRIAAGMLAEPEPGLEYIVVLSQEEIEGESESELASRLDYAAAYLKANPETNVIVSGGWNAVKGSSKAHVMYQYLIRLGIESERIFWETHSHNTLENLRYSMVIAEGRDARLGIVSSDYFAYRSARMARRLGMYHTEGMPVSTAVWMLPHRVVAEVLCVLRDKLMGI